MYKQYYKGWPTWGNYVSTLNKVNKYAISYLRHYSENFNAKKASIVFDIDDTLVYTDPYKNFKYDIVNVKNDIFIYPSIEQISTIARFAKKLGFKIIIITARPQKSEKSSIENLKKFKIPFDDIFHAQVYPPPYKYKIELKQKLDIKNNIILSIGDQWPDVLGLDKKYYLGIKLPEPDDTNCYICNNKSIIKII